MSGGAELFRATILHTPRNPFSEEHALESYADGALAIANGSVLAIGDYATIHAAHPDAAVTDWRGSVILPGFIDTHTHFPQTRIIGGLGWPLARLAAAPCAARRGAHARHGLCARRRRRIRRRVDAPRNHNRAGLRRALRRGDGGLVRSRVHSGGANASGLVVSDRALPDGLCQTPDKAYRISNDLIARYHGRDGQRYAVTPRFALSTSEGMLEVCGALMREHPSVLFRRT